MGHRHTVRNQIRRRKTRRLIRSASLYRTSAYSAEPDQTPQNAASDQGLHCLLTKLSISKHTKILPNIPRIGNGLLLLIWVGKPIRLEYLKTLYEPRHEMSNNVVCATSKASDQPADTRSLIRAFASRLNIL